MYKWLLQATKARPPIKANDFSKFVGLCYRNNITDKTSRLWMHELGFSFSTADALQLYHDGQQRDDVLRALKDYVDDMLNLRASGQIVMYTGDNMEEEVSLGLEETLT
jgi:hypothetical protein